MKKNTASKRSKKSPNSNILVRRYIDNVSSNCITTGNVNISDAILTIIQIAESIIDIIDTYLKSLGSLSSGGKKYKYARPVNAKILVVPYKESFV